MNPLPIGETGIIRGFHFLDPLGGLGKGPSALRKGGSGSYGLGFPKATQLKCLNPHYSGTWTLRVSALLSKKGGLSEMW